MRTKLFIEISSMFLLMFIVLGIIYPIMTTFLGNILFPDKANGSLIKIDNKIYGSYLIGQNFSSLKYFHPRPSETSDFPYNPMSSGSSNLAPTNQGLIKALKENAKTIEKTYNVTLVSSSLAESSFSGLEPYITLKDALMEAPIIAKENNIDLNRLKKIILENSFSNSFFGIEPLVNTMRLNEEIYKISNGRR